MSPLSSHDGGGGWPGGAGGIPPGPLGGANYFGDGSDGDVTIAADTSLTSTQDGDVVVKNYNNVTIDAGKTLTVSTRCKGLIVNVLGDLTVNGTISMTGRGAAVDPAVAGVSAAGLALRWRTVDGSPLGAAPDLAGCGAAAFAWAAKFRNVATGVEALVPRTGGSGGARVEQAAGNTGGAATNALGGGGAGGERTDITNGTAGAGAAATCFSGGTGGGGAGDGDGTQLSTAGAANGGAGGNSGYTSRSGGAGAGNPAGVCLGSKPIGTAQNGQDGTGGLLVINVKGNITIASGGLVSAHGKNGGAAPNTTGGGGGSGGGRVIIAHGGSYTNGGTVAANGGAGGVRGESLTANAAGGPGGVGAVTVLHVKP